MRQVAQAVGRTVARKPSAAVLARAKAKKEATTPLRSEKWLQKKKTGPNVYAFRNIESGQVVFSQQPHPKELEINNQFMFASWQNKKPSTRKDIWRPMAVAQLPSYDSAVQFYKNLVELRYMRDRTDKSVANDWRKKNDDGNIWFYSQFRPTYTQEAVADIASAVEAADVPCNIKWENEWRRGDEKHWEGLPVTHETLPAHNPREQFVILKQIALESLVKPVESTSETEESVE